MTTFVIAVMAFLAGAAMATVLLFSKFLTFWMRELEDRRAEETALNARLELREAELAAERLEHIRRQRILAVALLRQNQLSEMDDRTIRQVLAGCRAGEGKAALN